MSQSSLKQRTLHGLSWSLLSQVVGVAMTLVIGIVLARLLGPSQFGLIAMVTVITQFGQVFAEMGMGDAIVQKPELSKRDSSTAFWINCLLGLLIACIIALFSGFIADFYDRPILVEITWWVALNFVINSLGTIQKSLLHRNLEFRKLFYVNSAATLAGGVVGIVLAVLGWGVWSLVAKLLIETTTRTIVLWTASPWRPNMLIDRSALRYVAGFGLPLAGTQSINYWARNVDNLAIGRVWGDVELGYYNRAYSLMLLPLGQISSVVARVMFPSLATIQHDKQRVKRIFLKTIGSVALLSFPMSIGIFVLAGPIVLTMYGPKWAGSIELLQVLSLLGINQSVGTLNGIIFRSQHATMLQFKWGLIVQTLCIIAIFIGLPYGAKGVAIAYTATSMAITIPGWVILGRVIPIRVREILRVCAAPFLASIAMGVVVFVIDQYLLPDSHVAVRMGVGIATGVAVFFGLISLARPAAWEDAKLLVRERLSKSKPANLAP